MKYNLDIVKDKSEAKDPSLVEMTEKAIDILSKNEEGFFLLVESGTIDLAHHYNEARLAIDETVELSKAIAAAKAKINLNETLMVITSDHSHTMSFSGYPVRRRPYISITLNIGFFYPPSLPLFPNNTII